MKRKRKVEGKGRGKERKRKRKKEERKGGRKIGSEALAKISNKLAGDVACLGGSMVEHQPRLLGSRVRFPVGAFAIFSVSAKASLPISLPPPFPFLFLSLPLPFLSSSFPFDLSFCAFKISLFALIPLITSDEERSLKKKSRPNERSILPPILLQLTKVEKYFEIKQPQIVVDLYLPWKSFTWSYLATQYHFFLPVVNGN